MKKMAKAIFVSFLALAAAGVWADGWSPIGLEWGGCIPDEATTIYGLRLGLFRGNHNLRGLGLSLFDVADLFSSGHTTITGVNLSLCGSTVSTEHFALLAGGAGVNANIKSGAVVELGGLGCDATDGFAVSVAPLTAHYGASGIQVGVFNVSESGGNGLQVGFCNWARGEWHGMQIGLANVVEYGWVLPILNFQFQIQ